MLDAGPWVLVVVQSRELCFQIVYACPRRNRVSANFWDRTQQAIVSLAQNPLASVVTGLIFHYL